MVGTHKQLLNVFFMEFFVFGTFFSDCFGLKIFKQIYEYFKLFVWRVSYVFLVASLVYEVNFLLLLFRSVALL